MRNIFKKKKKNTKCCSTILSKYDSENRLIWEKDAFEFIREYQYHNIWRNKFASIKISRYPKVMEDCVAFPKEKKFDYDERGNLILILYSNGSRVEYEYDERGNKIKTYEEWV